MFKGVIVFGAGIYTGVYIAQNYQIEPVDSPSAIIEKLREFIKTKTEK